MTFMKCVISGGTGFIGRRVVKALQERGHYTGVWSREPGRETRDAVASFKWDPLDGEPLLDSLNRMDAVIHLAGVPVAQRWNAEVKAKIRDSRVQSTRHLVNAIRRVEHRP